MSDFHVQVVRLTDVAKHPNADTLSVGDANGHPVIFRTGDYHEGQLVTHVPIDAIVPDAPEWAFLDGNRRIKAKRLRGVFSMGMLAPAPAGASLGDNVQELLGITKYETVISGKQGGPMGGDSEPDPGFLPEYTDLESYRRYKTVLQDGEPVVLTEKTHGCNARFVFRDGRLWVGSHHCILAPPTEPRMRWRGYWRKAEDAASAPMTPSADERRIATRPFDTEEEAVAELKATIAAADGNAVPYGVEHALYTPKVSSWWQVARERELERRLAEHPDIAIYGEIFGAVQDLKYGRGARLDLVLFDAMDTRTFRYFNREEFVDFAADLGRGLWAPPNCRPLGLATVPVLYEGPWSTDLLALAEGKSTIPGADCIREGFVVKPIIERRDRMLGRVALKVVGEGYLTRKGA
jgi:RNA ligase (TIGR02306 family)